MRGVRLNLLNKPFKHKEMNKMTYKNCACEECEKRINVKCWAWMSEDEINPVIYDRYEAVFIDAAHHGICPCIEIENILNEEDE